ncbi:MAG: hypothetical protein K9W43_02320 [Candidatus Thorarchaeota archaeon]|nr:hypothetical protein [Candidatus Thorarchaeota archaeon]
MPTGDCQARQQLAEDMASEGHNSEAMDLFIDAAMCWRRWESFAKVAGCLERAYEHGMLAHRYFEAAEAMKQASLAWTKQGEHEKFEIDCQIASEAYIMAAEEDHNPRYFVDGAFCAILGGDIDMARHLIHAAAETTRGEAKEMINLALMLSEYQFGDADMYIEAAVTRIMDREGMKEVHQLFKLAFLGFVRTILESEVAISLRSLSDSTGLPEKKIEKLIKEGIDEGIVPGSFDPETQEIVVDPDRTDISTLARRKRPILSRDLKDPGAWTIDSED